MTKPPPATPTVPSTQTVPAPDGYQQSLEFLYGRLNYERQVRDTKSFPFRLQRMSDLLRRLGLQRYLYQPGATAEVPLVHIAGTKGKGSTATMVASVLAQAGYRAGLYSSPHLHRLEERFRINGEPCSAAQLIELVQQLKPTVAEMTALGDSPTFFELTTTMALLHFHQSSCDAFVLEVGLGGRLDSTNVCLPSVSAITSIGFDHQNVLGDSIEEIAGEKAGILKPGIPVVSGVAQPEAKTVVRQRAESVGAPLYQLGQDFDVSHHPHPTWGSSVVVQSNRRPLTDRREFDLSMEGGHQARNAAVATTILDLLNDQGLSIGAEDVRQGMARSQCIGRIERWCLTHDRIAIVDSAHNDDSIRALCDTLNERYADRPTTVVFGTSQDKTAEPMLDALGDVATKMVLTRFVGNPRYRDPGQLLRLMSPSRASCAEVIDQPMAACEFALAQTPPGGVLVICGSFFLAAECRQWVQDQTLTR